MTLEQLEKTWHATPFRPFVIHMADGREVPVRHPDFISRSPSGRTIVVVQPDESLSIIDLLLINELHILAPRNGSSKGHKKS